jgi:hypothetical protein
MDQRDIAALTRELQRIFGTIKVISYIRRQDKLAVSHHQQGSRPMAIAATEIYGSSPKALPPYKKSLDRYLDFNTRLGFWADQVGDRNMIIKVYEKALLKEGDVVADFLGILGLHKQHETARENESNGFVKTKVGHLLNQIDFPKELSLYISRHLDNSGKMTPARAEAIAFYKRYRHSNYLLNQRFGIVKRPGIFDEDFDCYSELGREEWSESLAELAIKNILTAVSDKHFILQGGRDILSRAAEQLQDVKPQLSESIRDLISRLDTQHGDTEPFKYPRSSGKADGQ